MTRARLILESGQEFVGERFGGDGESTGEVVFNTALTGYQEVLSDPSYAGQIVVMTAPQIGNTGVTTQDDESRRVFCSGFVVREISSVVSNWRSDGDVAGYLATHGVVGLAGIDTRALTIAIREAGAQRAIIAAMDASDASVRERLLASPKMEGRNLVPEVTCKEPYEWSVGTWSAPDVEAVDLPAARYHVVAYDFGVKRNILCDLRDAGCRVTVVPATYPVKDALALSPDGFFLSNGPGDPAATTSAIETVRELVASNKPVFGICLGHQILSLAIGARTHKLPFGHHGSNHPVLDHATGRVEITSQNHGFAVDPESLPDTAECTHTSLYDGTVEGIRLKERPVFGVQYHPEASPGPHDAKYLFQRFVRAMA